ncbi:MAG: transaldolase family protein [Vampirovibrionales bacterium]
MLLARVTTNPASWPKNNHGDVKSVIQQIAKLVPPGPISVECVTDDAESMIRESETFVTWSDNIAVKVPMTVEGMKAVRHFSNNGIKTNVTLNDALPTRPCCANAGATFISSFVGRVDDIGFDGIGIIREVAEIIELHSFNSQVLAASIRHPLHVTQSATAGAHIATIPFKVIKQMYDHPLTEKGVASFKADWDQLQKSNLTPA